MEDLTNIMDRVTSYSNNNDNKICIDSVIEYCVNIHTVRMYIDKKNIENSKVHNNPLDLKITRDKYKICVEIFNYHYHYTDLIYRVVNFHSRAERRSTNLQKIYLDNYHLHSLIEELFINESPTTLRNFWCQEYTFINKFFDLKLNYISKHFIYTKSVYITIEKENNKWILHKQNNIIDSQEDGSGFGSILVPDDMFYYGACPTSVFNNID